jgi:hypothetical protein
MTPRCLRLHNCEIFGKSATSVDAVTGISQRLRVLPRHFACQKVGCEQLKIVVILSICIPISGKLWHRSRTVEAINAGMQSHARAAGTVVPEC